VQKIVTVYVAAIKNRGNAAFYAKNGAARHGSVPKLGAQAFGQEALRQNTDWISQQPSKFNNLDAR
jgi:hypothetical protein